MIAGTGAVLPELGDDVHVLCSSMFGEAVYLMISGTCEI